MDKKLSGAGAAIVGALLYGGAQLLDIEERLAALEAKQEEESAEEPAAEASEDVEEAEPNEEPAEEPEAAPEAEKAEEE
jgi:hypothetical protein